MLALDEPGDADVRFESQGYTLCIDKELLTQVSTISIEYSHMGFSVEPGTPLTGGGSGCSGCASSGGCSTA